MPSPILKHFAAKHLPIQLRAIARPFEDMASNLDALLPEGPEKTTALRKLLESLDCVIRAAVDT
jgi:hypothetical protein